MPWLWRIHDFARIQKNMNLRSRADADAAARRRFPPEALRLGVVIGVNSRFHAVHFRSNSYSTMLPAHGPNPH